MKKNPPEKD